VLVRILYYYYKTLWLKHTLKTKDQLIAYQEKQFKKHIKKTLSKTPFYQAYLDKPLHEWPVINKKIMMEHFNQLNTVNLSKEEALDVALKAEKSRDFSPLIKDIAVGLSSGTSGNRGLFLTSPKERDAWAGIILAKVLPNGLRTKERIAFFLRANNNLYTTLNKNRKIQFHFFDLLHDFDEHIKQLNILNPTILSAPASVLLELARHKKQLTIKPKKIYSVAEVLEPNDDAEISDAFNCPVSQVYQCTEGFLAINDKHSNHLVMNEEFLIIEKEWLDENRFVPIITDLFRTTQPIVRYRLDDVLVLKNTDNIFTELTAIEGRVGDICYGKKEQKIVPIFSDTLRQQMASSPVTFDDYLICQHAINEFSIQVTPELVDKNILIDHLNTLFRQKACDIPNWNWQVYEKKAMDVKRRRIQSKIC
jgi:putative adenylate-forming enzyme